MLDVRPNVPLYGLTMSTGTHSFKYIEYNTANAGYMQARGMFNKFFDYNYLIIRVINPHCKVISAIIDYIRKIMAAATLRFGSG